MISKRTLSVDSSGIRRVFDLAQKIKNPINLSIGQPDFEALPELKVKAKAAIDENKNSYTVTQGIGDLRQEIAGCFGFDINQSDCPYGAMVTSGVSGGLMLCYMAMLDPGDEVLIADPFFCMYRDVAKLINAVPVYYDTYPNFGLSVEKIEEKISPRTKAILVNSPCNPTGYAVEQNELDAVVELCRRHGIWLIYDEIYNLFCYDKPHAKCFGKYENTVILNGFSKSHGITGWRVGYAVGPKTLINEMCKVQQYSFVCAPSIAQWSLVGSVQPDLSNITASYKEKRDFVYEGLKNKFDVVKPQGAFYIFPKAPGGSGQKFVEKCIEKNVLIVPGHVFSERDTHFRISFAASMETLGKGVEVLNSLA